MTTPNVSFITNAALMMVLAGLIFLPLARYWQESPQMFWYRAMTRSAVVEREVAGSAVFTFLDNVKNALLMFNYRGDSVAINTIPGSPVLDPLTGAMFILGAAYVLFRLVRYRDRRSVYLLVMMFMLLLPSTLSIAFPNENPSVVRTGGTIPITMTIAALGIYILARRLHAALEPPGSMVLGRGAAVAVGAVVLFLGVAVARNYDWYFRRYDAQWRAAAWNTSEMGRVVRGFADSIGDLNHAWHVPFPHWADTRNIGFKAGAPRWENALPIDDAARLRSHAADPAPKLYLVHLDDTRALQILRPTYPTGIVRQYQSSRPGQDFWAFLAPGAGQIA